MGICKDFEVMAKKVQECAKTQKRFDGIQEMVSGIGNVCTQACIELEEEVARLNK
jgi:glutamate dehydrogenase/leucine dehydrogenase